MNEAPVRIAVVGHTNTGKTSLLRTLTRDTAFGTVSDRPATTRDVQGIELLAGKRAVLALYDTPGLEDAIGTARALAEQLAPAADPVAAIEAFLAGDHGRGLYEQEAKVLRQVLRSDAALYVIDAREPMRAKHREELRLLAACGRPLMPVLNFVAGAEADIGGWKNQLARMGLHVLAEFDTVVFDHEAERQLYRKLATLLEARRVEFEQLLRERDQQRDLAIRDACRAIAELLALAAAARLRVALEAPADAFIAGLRERVRSAEQHCVETLLQLFRFDLDAYSPPTLPLSQGRWALDPFDPETLRRYGIGTGSAAAAGGMAGLAVDAMTGFMSLGAAAALGAGIGAAWNTARTFGQPWLDRVRGHQQLQLDDTTLALLATRQLLLLSALLRRGHASTAPVTAGTAQGWPSAAVRTATLRCRTHPVWSAPDAGRDAPVNEADMLGIADALRQALLVTVSTRTVTTPGAPA